MKTAAGHAERIEPSWSKRALSFIMEYSEQTFMVEEVREWAYRCGLPRPPNERAWGGVVSKARKEGLIRHVGFRSVTNPKAHRTPASVWRKVENPMRQQ
jgi:hypothetical protein